MADNGEGGDENRSSNIAELRKQVLSLVTRRFEGTIEKPISDVVSRVLCKRRKKWRKRHDLPSEGKKLTPMNITYVDTQCTNNAANIAS